MILIYYCYMYMYFFGGQKFLFSTKNGGGGNRTVAEIFLAEKDSNNSG